MMMSNSECYSLAQRWTSQPTLELLGLDWLDLARLDLALPDSRLHTLTLGLASLWLAPQAAALLVLDLTPGSRLAFTWPTATNCLLAGGAAFASPSEAISIQSEHASPHGHINN